MLLLRLRTRPIGRHLSGLASSVDELAKSAKPKDTVSVNGWVLRSQKFGKMTFVRLADGLSPTNIQVVVPRSICKSVPVGSAITVNGSWKASQGAEQSMELEASSLHILATDQKPVYECNSPDVLREQVHLRVKHPGYAALIRMRSRLLGHLHSYFQDKNYVYIDTPALTSNDCEGAGETFVVQADKENFFGNDRKMFLSVSGQLHLEAMANGLSKVYSFGNTFRADIQQYSRTHMSEFRMLEVEVAFCDSLEEICNIAEKYVRSAIEFVNRYPEELKLIYGFNSEGKEATFETIDHQKAFPRITYDEALQILKDHDKLNKGSGLSRTSELFLVDHFKSPIFVTHFPASIKPFYMKPLPNGTTESFDLLMPLVGEVAGGSVREENGDLILERSHNKEALNWYYDIRRRGKPVSSGFGIGFDRLVQCLLGVRSVRDTIPFPRWHAPEGRTNAQC